MIRVSSCTTRSTSDLSTSLLYSLHHWHLITPLLSQSINLILDLIVHGTNQTNSQFCGWRSLSCWAKHSNKSYYSCEGGHQRQFSRAKKIHVLSHRHYIFINVAVRDMRVRLKIFYGRVYEIFGRQFGPRDHKHVRSRGITIGTCYLGGFWYYPNSK